MKSVVAQDENIHTFNIWNDFPKIVDEFHSAKLIGFTVAKNCLNKFSLVWPAKNPFVLFSFIADPDISPPLLFFVKCSANMKAK